MSKADEVLAVLQGQDELIPSRFLREQVGTGWRDGLRELRARGVVVEETVGASGNHSFRLAPDYESSPRKITITITESDARAILKAGEIPTTAWNTIVNALSS